MNKKICIQCKNILTSKSCTTCSEDLRFLSIEKRLYNTEQAVSNLKIDVEANKSERKIVKQLVRDVEELEDRVDNVDVFSKEMLQNYDNPDSSAANSRISSNTRPKEIMRGNFNDGSSPIPLYRAADHSRENNKIHGPPTFPEFIDSMWDDHTHRMRGPITFGEHIDRMWKEHNLKQAAERDRSRMWEDHKRNLAPERNRSMENRRQREIHQPIITQPNLNQPKISQSNLNQPRINQPIINQPKINQPTINQSNINQPIINQPTINRPNLNQPRINQPILNRPNINQPNLKQTRIIQPSINQPNINQNRRNNSSRSNINTTTSSDDIEEFKQKHVKKDRFFEDDSLGEFVLFEWIFKGPDPTNIEDQNAALNRTGEDDDALAEFKKMVLEDDYFKKQDSP